MASANTSWSEENCSCSICQDVFNSPVSTPCGHNFCRTCITMFWDDQVQYKCPLCNERFHTRPDLRVNTFISEMVDQFRRSVRVKEQPCVEPGEVSCEVCTGTKLKAVKSCLMCLASYCHTHLEPHQRVAGLKKHQLVEPMDRLEDRMCKKHERLLELFCQTEQVCVCLLCTVTDHKSHPVVPLKEEYEVKKAPLGKMKSKVQQMIQERQRKIQEINNTLKRSKADADREIANGVLVLSALMSYIEKWRDDLNQTVKEKLKSTEKQAEGLIKELEQEIKDLTNRSSEVKQLSLIKDHLHFLQTFTSLKNPPHTRDWTTVEVRPPSYVGSLGTFLDQLEETLNMEMKKLRDLNQDACELTLDPNTAHRRLSLSEDHREVKKAEEHQSYPDHPERFDSRAQVLCREGLTGRCYWEVERRGCVAIGVTYRGITRRGEGRDSLLGGNNKSWRLYCTDDRYTACYKDSKTVIPLPASGSTRVGVYLDRPAGSLSFYRVSPGVGGSSDTLTLIHTFQTTFTQEDLLPGFGFAPGPGMASANTSWSEDNCSCSICLDVFNSPVTTPCGHNFCRTCITTFWDDKVQYKCPVCNELFHTRPDLRVNTLLSEMVDQFRRSVRVKEQPCVQPGEVPCDVCTGTKLKAVKFCLMCLASYCHTHLEPHQRVAGLQTHQLVEPMDRLEDRMCKKHKRLLEVFCQTDQVCVCLLCTVTDHKSHPVVPLEEEYKVKKAPLGKMESEVQQLIQERRRKIQEINDTVERSKADADREIANGVLVLSALMSYIEKWRDDLNQTVKEKLKSTEKQAEDLIKELEQEIKDLTNRSSEVKQLLLTEDHLHFLQTFTSLKNPPHTRDWTMVEVRPPSYVGSLGTSLDQLEETLNMEMKELRDLNQDACELTLDPNTAHRGLSLFGDHRKVMVALEDQSYPDHPERFDSWYQVLCREGLTGRCYWEVERRGYVYIGVTYRGIIRRGKGHDSQLGGKNKSWRLDCYDDRYAAWYNDSRTVIPLPPSGSTRVGVYLDRPAGSLSFYRVSPGVGGSSHTLTLIHTFQTTFTQEDLLPGFGFLSGPGPAHLDVLPAPWIPAGLYGVLPPDVGPVSRMASANTSWSEENCSCSICLDVFNSPVTTPCGHNFCRTCITTFWDDQVQYKCPVCNELFHTRPDLRVNTLLSEMVDQFRRSVRVKEQPCVQPGEVLCDVCTGTQLKAVKFCLMCLASYCHTHLEPHQRVAGLQTHQLVEPTDRLEDSMCKKHKRLLEVFCQTDQVCVCLLCTVTDHKSHPVVPLEEEYKVKKALLGKMESEVQQLIQERRRKIQEINETVERSEADADREIADGVQVLTALMSYIGKWRDDLNQTVKEKLKSTEKQAEGLIKELEQEINDLTNRSSEVKQLSLTEDHLHFLQTFRSLKNPPHTRDWTTVEVRPPSYVGSLGTSLDQLEETLNMEMKKLRDLKLGVKMCKCQFSLIHHNTHYLDGKSNRYYIQHKNIIATTNIINHNACELTLDPNTAHRRLSLSEDHRKVKRVEELQSYPDHPERFDSCPQVLCREGLTGRCYWEVERRGGVGIGVTYRGITRRGGSYDSRLGWNNKSWRLECNDDSYTARYNNSKTVIRLTPSGSTRVGVYLDRPAGSLSFYRVSPGVGGSSDTLTLIHTFQTTFTQENLLPGFWLWSGPGMASANTSWSEENCSCSICLDVFNSPVTTPCGHNFCRTCITTFWDDKVQYKCPVCNELFHTRPDLRVNTLLSEMVDQFRQSVQVTEQPCVEPGEVPCDVCTGTQLKAVKSCLMCLASYCHTHLEPHQRVAGLQTHQLVEPMDRLEDRMCKKHKRLLEVFCQTDQVCVCLLCTVMDHKSHPVVPLEEEYKVKKAPLGKMESEVQQLIQERRRKIQEINDTVGRSKADADREIANGVLVLSALMSYIEKWRDDLNQTVKEKLKSTEKEAEGLIKELEQEVEDLTNRSSEVKQLSLAEDHLHFLQTFTSLKNPPQTRDWTTVEVRPPSYVGSLGTSLDQLEETLNMEMKKLRDLNQDACELTLDPNTAYTHLSLSEDHREVKRVKEVQSYPDHPERFDSWHQVLCRESLTGRCYWEVERRGDVAIGVTYRGITRRGEGRDGVLGGNNKSWRLYCDDDRYTARYNDSETVIPLPPSASTRVGVYLDRPAGSLSFYRVSPGVGGSSHTLTLIHTFSTTFTQEDLLPGFGFWFGSSVSLCRL
ncbi:E3 ubiquitin/ISG15 ligase TRIM25 [Merluccius polli]|uniref:E3 ubiquitin/ISG15 ligase TRIM25 n=1 Tax=Merluccius polli TaxID=89951 RepID=A0AA47P9M8_MERPO|nr:E3 ubiquitin/ISG15 ligase TRIM25 [Merluccius polli]